MIVSGGNDSTNGFRPALGQAIHSPRVLTPPGSIPSELYARNCRGNAAFYSPPGSFPDRRMTARIGLTRGCLALRAWRPGRGDLSELSIPPQAAEAVTFPNLGAVSSNDAPGRRRSSASSLPALAGGRRIHSLVVVRHHPSSAPASARFVRLVNGEPRAGGVPKCRNFIPRNREFVPSPRRFGT